MSEPPFPADYRASGILLHVTSLPGPYGIGDLGPAAVTWIDRLHEAGQTWWQALPLGPTGYGDSPYQSLSSFAGNWFLISPDWLIEDELLKPGDFAGQIVFVNGRRFRRRHAIQVCAAREGVEELQRRRAPGPAA
jgi:4-alpha-glucanotransferase